MLLLLLICPYASARYARYARRCKMPISAAPFSFTNIAADFFAIDYFDFRRRFFACRLPMPMPLMPLPFSR